MDVLEDERVFQREVDTVRVLHHTVVTLRAALERSRVEIEELKERVWTSETCEQALQNLSVENHILRQKIISIHEYKENTTQTSIPYITVEENNKQNQEIKSSTTNSFVTIIENEHSPRLESNRTGLFPRNLESAPRDTSPCDRSLQFPTDLPDFGSRELGLSGFTSRNRSPTIKDDIFHLSLEKLDSDIKSLSEFSVLPERNAERSPIKIPEPQSKNLFSVHPEINASRKKDTGILKNSNTSPLKSTGQEKKLNSKHPTNNTSSSLILPNLSPLKTSEVSTTRRQSPRDIFAPASNEIKLSAGKNKNSSASKSATSPSGDTKKTKLKPVIKTVKLNAEEVLIKSSASDSSPSKEIIKEKVCADKKRVQKKVNAKQTIVTVNVTLKSPRTDENTSPPGDKKTLVTVTTELPKKIFSSDDTSGENSIPDITDEDDSKIMDGQNNIRPDENNIEQKESDNENDECDDIELIFTTDETTTSVIKEELVSIADGNEDEGGNCDTPVLMNYRQVDFETPDLNLSCEAMDKDLEDDVFQETEATDNIENENTENLNFQNSASHQIHNSKSDNSINRESIANENESQRDKSLKSCYSYQDSSFESRSLDKDESFDKFDDKDKYLHSMWSNNSVLVETDISKCGIVDPELPISSTRRNTCPNPVPYRPIMHREALAKHNNSRTLAVKFYARNESSRPILNENNSPKTESEAQTDISALPSLWKSESYLAHKVAHHFTTLPSKFPMPISQKALRLSEKTKEARRVLLSDINFTSMVPELSRSADHLYQDGMEVMQTCSYGQYLNPPGAPLRRHNTGDSLTSPSFIHSQKFTYSPSDYSNFSSTKFVDNSNQYLNRYRGSLTSINMQNSFDMPENMKRRSLSSHWRQNIPASFDNSRYMQSGQGPYRSVPSSPTRSRSVPFISNYGQQYPGAYKHSQVRFGRSGYSGIRYMNGSLPELHGDHDSGDSTDSLVEEAEQYLRSSIDCIVSGRDMAAQVTHSTKRRASAPSPGRDSSPPRNWKPFLPHGIKDLRSDNWVKVIGPEGKIRGGRVRYVGYVLDQQEPYVGIELATKCGNSDGSFNNRKYFECSSNHALFIPFKKVVMGWRN